MDITLKKELPETHKRGILKTHQIVQDRGLTFSESQLATQLTLDVAVSETPIKTLKAMNDVITSLKEKGFNNVDMGVIVNSLVALLELIEPVRIIDTAAEITQEIDKAGIDKVDTRSFLQVYSEKINKRLESLTMKELDIENLEHLDA
jgi:hypothetical protein